MEVYVVGYWSNVALVTTDKEKAENLLVKKRGEAPALPWAIRSVEDAITHAYATGLDDGRADGGY